MLAPVARQHHVSLARAFDVPLCSPLISVGKIIIHAIIIGRAKMRGRGACALWNKLMKETAIIEICADTMPIRLPDIAALGVQGRLCSHLQLPGFDIVQRCRRLAGLKYGRTGQCAGGITQVVMDLPFQVPYPDKISQCPQPVGQSVCFTRLGAIRSHRRQLSERFCQHSLFVQTPVAPVRYQPDPRFAQRPA